ncbi:MAG: hypothetical protein PCFJNLEI_00006 [Verrucomicrobiae bacterium]|nr:hypothetical protein [Verrucomicrobiae bacterium]
MRWSFPIGRISGISLRLHVTFLALLLFIGYSTYRELNLLMALWSVGFICAVFGCIILHELGHSLVAQQFGIEVRSITLLPIGGVAALKSIPQNPWHEIAITLAGPLVNAVIALLLLPVIGLPKELLLVYLPHDFHAFLTALLKANLTLFLFNFIPAFPMDGGRLVRAVLALVLPYHRATSIAALIGQAIAIIFIMAGLTGSQLLPGVIPFWLIIIGVFIFLGAEAEERLVRTRTALADCDVAAVMMRNFVSLTPTDSCEHATRLLFQTGQDDFPVLADDRFLGSVSRADILKTTGPVETIMDQTVPPVSPHDRLVQVYDEILAEGWGSVPVLEDDRLVGWLTNENINRYLAVRRGGAGRKPALPPGTATVRPVAPPPPPAKPAPPTAPA